MPEFSPLTDAERELLHIIRGESSFRDFTVRVELKDGQWTVEAIDRSQPQPPWHGQGRTFTEAWTSGEVAWPPRAANDTSRRASKR